MTRRFLLFGIGTSAAASEPQGSRVPTHPDELNAFAAQYGVYIEALRNNVVDLKQWSRVVRTWRRLTGGS